MAYCAKGSEKIKRHQSLDYPPIHPAFPCETAKRIGVSAATTYTHVKVAFSAQCCRALELSHELLIHAVHSHHGGVRQKVLGRKAKGLTLALDSVGQKEESGPGEGRKWAGRTNDIPANDNRGRGGQPKRLVERSAPCCEPLAIPQKREESEDDRFQCRQSMTHVPPLQRTKVWQIEARKKCSVSTGKGTT